MNRFLAVLLVLVLLPSPALSVHSGTPDPLEPVQLPPGPIVHTENPFVDRTQEEAIDAANEGILQFYSAVEPTVRPALEDAPQSVITLFRDGMVSDPRYGALEDWRQHGGWAPREGDAYDGDWSRALGDADGYPTDARAALVLPELDLRTGFDPGETGGTGIGRQEVEVSTATVTYDPDDEGGSVTVEEPELLGSHSVTIPDVLSDGGRDVVGRFDPQVVLEYWARHNLGDRQDGVQVWLLEERPDPEALTGCTADAGCTVLNPRLLEGDGPSRASTAAFGTTAYTGTADWGRHFLDLTPWAEQRVWVAFVFRSAQNFQGDSYFEENEWFDHDSFFGFQLDEVQLHAAAAPANLQVREPASPEDGALYDTMVDIPFQSFVRNTGSIALDARITVDVTDGTTSLGEDYRTELGPVELRPGEVLPVTMTFPALEEDRLGLVATVAVEAQRDLRPTLEEVVSVDDVNEADDVRSVRFDVQRIRLMELATPTVTADWVGLDEDFEVGVTVTNLGTFTDDITLVPTVVDNDDGSDVTNALVIGQQVHDLTLGPGEDTTVTWSLRTSEVGRYKVLVDAPAPHDLHVVTRPFGIGTGPPPIVHHDFGASCPDWNYQHAVGPDVQFQGVTVGHDAWQCGPYGPEGRDLLYVGLKSNGEPCGIGACLPHAGGGGNPETTAEAVVATDPILVHGNDPYLVLRHQYATPVHIQDPIEGRPRAPSGDIYIVGVAYVTAHADGQQYYLTPGILSDDSSRHHDTEETVGILDPRNEPNGRDFSYRRAAGLASVPGFCQDRPYHNNLPPSTAPSCGWWHPTGSQDRLRGQAPGAYRSPGDDYPVGETFHGSPWKIDHIPLTGTHWQVVDGHGNREQPYEVDLRGREVEFRFHYVLSSEAGVTSIDPLLEPGKDYGWRISDLAITDGPLAVRDLALVGAELATPYDAEAIGVGPDADIRVDMTIANLGRFAMQDVQAVVYCYDIETGLNTRGARLLPDPLEPGQTLDTHAACKVPATYDRIRIEARVETLPSDDVPFNDAVQVDGLYDVRASPDLSVSTRVSPESGSAGLRRALLVDVRNEGNVPVSGFDVSIQVNEGASDGATRTWTVLDEVPVGGTLRLGPTVQTTPQVLATDLRYNPLETSSYSAIAIVEAAGDVDDGDDVGATTFRAVNTLYADDTQGAPEVDLPTLVNGARSLEGDPIWHETTVNGRSVLRAGDGDVVPAESDASIVLPTIDLTSADGATLVLRHAYDLEHGYDAGRVEASTDGETWTPMTPVATPDNPRGYPDVTLTGSNALLGDAAQAQAGAFTGSSRDDPTADASGFVSTEFDLAALPDLQARRPLAVFPLEELESHAGTKVKEGEDVLFGDSTWTTTPFLHEGWLLDNRTLNVPRPHSGETMWWSGSAGEFLVDKQPFTVITALDVPIDLTGVADDRGAAFTFWDWRAGWRDADGKQSTRPGSGADFEVRITGHPDGAEVTPRPVEFADDGWTRREIDLSSFVGDELVIEFRYESSTRTDGHRNNIGWFLDDLLVQEYRLEDGRRTNVQDICSTDLEGVCKDDLEGRTTQECGGTGPYSVRVEGDKRFKDTGKQEDKGHCWSLVPRGLERPGAWHVDTVSGPDGRETRAWRIASDDPVGYPNLLDSRLVTPPVDLRGVVGDDAVLRFDHRYDLEADQQGQILTAIDGGVVEYQVFDPATGAYGPWRQLTNAPVEPTIVERPFGISRPQDILESNLDDIGYPAMYIGGITQFQSPAAALGMGAPFDVYPGYCVRCPDDGWSAYPTPFAYAFSGDSGGWRSESFDLSPLVGEKVRFAFHAWTNTQDGKEGVLEEPRVGWDVMNVAVEGTVFTGQPVQVRLRAATDGSVLDGHWTIDHIDVSAAILERNLGLQAQEGLLRFPTSTGIDFPVDIVNLGTQPRIGVALGVRAVDIDTGATLPVELTSARGDVVPEEDIITPLDGETVFGPVALTSVGTSNGGATWQVRVPDAPVGTRVAIQARILEDRGSGLIQDDGRPDIQYGLPQESQLANTRMTWDAVVQDAAILSFEPRRGDFPLQVDGAGPGSTGDVTVTGLLTNVGTLDITFDLEWTLRTTAGDLVQTQKHPTVVDAGDAAALALDLTGLAPGDYRVTAAVPDGPSASVEFPVERPETLWAENFNGPLPGDWSIQGGSSARWRTGEEPGRFLWGVHPFSGQGYCQRLGCGSGTEGYHHAATTPPVDLRLALNDQATLTLDHSFFFSQHDGGRLQAAVVDAAGVPRSCTAGGDPEWMDLVPSGGARHDGETRSGSFGPIERANPIHPAEVFQGPQGSMDQPVQTTYALGDLAWCEGEASETLLREATVRLRLDVGVRDMPNQPNRPGWQVDRIGVSSGGVALGPTTDGAVRVIDMVRNAPKHVAFEVENLGLADDEYELTVEFPSQDGGVTLLEETLPLPGRGKGLTWVRIDTSESLPVGPHALTLRAQSIHDPDSVATLTTILNILHREKADLSVSLGLVDGYEQDSISVVPIRVENLGRIASRPTVVTLEAIAPDGTVEPVETREVPGICALSECGPIDSVAIVNAEWSVPPVPGDYFLRARVDPNGHLLDLDSGNNVVTEAVRVVPLQLPDLVVTELEVNPRDGRFLDDGSIITVTVTLRNDGHIAAKGAMASIYAGSVTLTDVHLPVIAPGKEHTLTATKVVQAGASDTLDVGAIITGGADPEIRYDNNELIRSFSIRTHDVHILVRDGLAVRAGGLASVPVEVRNDGNSLERLTLTVGDIEGWKVQVLTPNLIVPPEGSLTGIVLVQPPVDAKAGPRLLPLALTAGGRTVASTPATITVAEVLEAATVEHEPEDVRSGDGVVRLVTTSRSNVDQTVRVADALGWLEETEVLLDALAGRTLEVPLRIPTETPPGRYEDTLTVAAVDGSWSVSLERTWNVLTTVAVDAAWSEVEGLDSPGDGTRALGLRLVLDSLGNVPTAVNASAETRPGTRVTLPEPVILEPLEKRVLLVTVHVDERLRSPQGTLLLNLEGGGANDTVALPLPDLAVQPDLTVTALPADGESPRVDEPATQRVVVRNIGNAPSPPNRMHLYVDGVLAAVAPVPTLLVGEEVELSLRWVPARTGTHDLSVVADGGGEVLELHEDNNGRALRTTVTGPESSASVLHGAPAPALAWLVMGLALLTLRRRWT